MMLYVLQRFGPGVCCIHLIGCRGPSGPEYVTETKYPALPVSSDFA